MVDRNPLRLSALACGGLLALGWVSCATAQTETAGSAGGARSLSIVPGVRTSLFITDSSNSSGGTHQTGYTYELTPYVNASVSNSRTQGTLSYSMRNFVSHTGDSNDSYMRHDLRATLNSLLIGDWFGVQSSAAIYNTNATFLGGLSADPATSARNNASLRTFSVSPYLQGRVGAFATYRVQYRYDLTDTSNTVQAGLSKGSHLVSMNLTGGPQFNPWGWGLSGNASRRDFQNGLSLGSESAVATLFYTPSPELRIGGSLNYLHIERLTNASGDTRGIGPGLSIDWNPGRRTALRASVTRQYYGTSEFLSLSHRTTQFVFGLDYTRSVLQSNNAALLTFNPGDVFSGGGFAPALNPLFTQLADNGLLSNSNTVIGTNIINDALVRNRTLTASVGYVMPRWSATATAFRSVRETLLSSEVFGIPNGLSPASFGTFNSRGLTLSALFTLDARHSFGLSTSLRETDTSGAAPGSNTAKVRFTTFQGTLSSSIDKRTTATVGLRRTVQASEGLGGGNMNDNTLFGTLDFRLK